MKRWLSVFLSVGAALLFVSGCDSGPGDSKGSQRWWNVSVVGKGKDTALVVQVIDPKTKNISGTKVFAQGENLIVLLDSVANQGKPVSLCRGTFVYYFEGTQLRSGITQDAQRVQLLNTDVTIVGDSTVCYCYDYIAKTTGSGLLRLWTPGGFSTAPTPYTPEMTVFVSFCNDLGALFPTPSEVPSGRLVSIQLSPGAPPIPAMIVEKPMPVTVTGRAW